MSNRRSRIVEGSCWGCRRSRLKCDLTKPTCMQCTGREQTCSYGSSPPIKWVGAAASRGRRTSPPSPESTRSTLSPTPALTKLPAAQPLEQGEVILYFANAVLPRFQIPDEPIHVDFDNVLQDDALRQTIMAVAQAHYAINSKVDVYDVAVVSKRTRQTAIEGFRKCLEQGVQSESSAQRLFAINILLCILDGMIEPSDGHNASTYHLRGGFAILNQWKNTPARMLLQDGLQAHLLSVYATMDLVHALLSGDKPFFQSMIWKMFADVQTWFGRLHSGDRFLDILSAFSDMAVLGNLIYNNPSTESVAWVEKCLAPIEAVFVARLESEAKQRRPSADSNIVYSSWAAFCSIYETCGFIYLQRALRNHSTNEDVVQTATRRGVEKLMDEKLPAMMRHCLVFPMLVIGSHCTLAQDRKAVLEVLSPASSYLSFGNMQLMESFLRAVWESGELHETWWQCFASVSQKAFLF